MSQENAYVSILRYPEHFTSVEKADLLISGLGLDPHQAALAVRRGFPQVVSRAEAAAVSGLLERLGARGVEAFAPSAADMRLAASSLRIRRLRPALGAPRPMYECEPAHGDPFGVRASDFALLVRASVPCTSSSVTGHSAAWNMPAEVSAPQTGVLGAAGLNNMSAARTVQRRVSEVLDIYLRDGSHLRIEADRFGFDLPVSARLQNDRQQLDALTQRLVSEAPGALMDLGYAEFHCPANIVRTHHAGAGETDNNRPTALAAFDFYTAWVWLLNTRPLSVALERAGPPEDQAG